MNTLFPLSIFRPLTRGVCFLGQLLEVSLVRARSRHNLAALGKRSGEVFRIASEIRI